MKPLTYVTLFGSALAAASCAWNGLFWSTVALTAVTLTAFCFGMLAPWED